jgi:hypothetical protein
MLTPSSVASSQLFLSSCALKYICAPELCLRVSFVTRGNTFLLIAPLSESKIRNGMIVENSHCQRDCGL